MLNEKKIRVLHIVTYMGRGGLETMIMNYYRYIDRKKIQFDFLVHRDFEADYDAEIESLGGKIYRLPQLNPISDKYLKALDHFFEEHTEYPIVHCHLDCMAGIPLKYAKKHNVLVRIAHAHSSSQTKDKKYLLKLYYKQKIRKYASHLLACADAAGKWMFQTNDFTVLNNAIDTSKYKYNEETNMQIRGKWNVPKDAIVVGHVGRFAPPKNHMFLISVFAEIVKRNEKAILLLVGDGELRSNAEEQVKMLGLEKQVIFAGQCSNVDELLQCMNVFVFPSIYEGLPVSLVEAQAAGLPCLISDKVPIECKKTDLVKQIGLQESKETWADEILKAAMCSKKDTSKEIIESGFDIVENAKWLENFYIKAMKEEK